MISGEFIYIYIITVIMIAYIYIISLMCAMVKSNDINWLCSSDIGCINHHYKPCYPLAIKHGLLEHPIQLEVYSWEKHD